MPLAQQQQQQPLVLYKRSFSTRCAASRHLFRVTSLPNLDSEREKKRCHPVMVSERKLLLQWFAPKSKCSPPGIDAIKRR